MEHRKELWDSLRIKINDLSMKAGRDLEKLGSNFALEELSLMLQLSLRLCCHFAWM